MVLTINYDRTSITHSHSGTAESVYLITGTNQIYRGKVSKDYYGRPAPVPAHGSGNLDRWTNSTHRIMDTMTVTFTVYEADKRKAGGRYVEITDSVKRVNTVNRVIELTSMEGVMNRMIKIDQVIDISIQ